MPTTSRTSMFRVATRYLQALVPPDPGNDVEDIKAQLKLMERLISKGEARRLGRTSDILITQMDYDGKRVTSMVQGVTDVYHPWITIRPAPGHHCNCQDWKKNGLRVGPCKHVLRLAEEWQDILVNKLERI